MNILTKMGAYIVKQPNGLYCRFSTVVDCPTHYNMTAEEYMDYCAERAREEAKWTLEHYLYPYENIKDDFQTTNMTLKEFGKLCKLMETPVEELNDAKDGFKDDKKN